MQHVCIVIPKAYSFPRFVPVSSRVSGFWQNQAVNLQMGSISKNLNERLIAINANALYVNIGKSTFGGFLSSTVVILGFDNRQRDVRLVIEQEVNSLPFTALDLFASGDDSAIGEEILFAHLRHQVPPGPFQSGHDELGADISFGHRFLIGTGHQQCLPSAKWNRCTRLAILSIGDPIRTPFPHSSAPHSFAQQIVDRRAGQKAALLRNCETC